LVYIRKMLCRQPNDRDKEVSLRLFTDHARKGGDRRKHLSKKTLNQTYTQGVMQSENRTTCKYGYGAVRYWILWLGVVG